MKTRPKHVLNQDYLAMRVCTAGIPFDKEDLDPPMFCHPNAEPSGQRGSDGVRPFHCPHCHVDFSTTDRLKAEKKTVADTEDDLDGRVGDALQQRARVT